MRILTILFLLIAVLSLGGKTYFYKTIIEFNKELIEALKVRGNTDVRSNFFEKCESYGSMIVLVGIALVFVILQ